MKSKSTVYYRNNYNKFTIRMIKQQKLIGIYAIYEKK